MPLYPSTQGMFDDKMLSLTKRGAYLINTARGALCDRDRKSFGRCSPDKWLATPATCGSRNPHPSIHPWRTMPNQGMTPHISGSSLSGQARYAAGTLEILECFFEGRPIPSLSI